MADDDQNNNHNEHNNADELEQFDEETAQRLLAAAVGKGDADDDQDDVGTQDTSRETAKDSTDWRAEAEKWKKLSRKNEQTARTTAEKLKEYEDQGKSESQRLQEERDSHKTRAEKAEAALKRREIAEARAPEHVTVAQIKAVAKRLAGETDDDLESDADELFALLAPKPVETPKVPERPKERLRGGGDPDEESEENDPKKLAALVPRRR